MGKYEVKYGEFCLISLQAINKKL